MPVRVRVPSPALVKMKKQKMKKQKKKTQKIIGTVFLVILFILIIFLLTMKVEIPENKVKFTLIRIEGPILSSAPEFYFYKLTDANEIVDEIKKAESFDGILLYINSPGGSASASFKIVDTLKKYKQETNKTIIAFIDEAGLSGAYLVASSADKIYANKMALVGSIGVIASYLEFAGFLERYNISYVRLVKGRYKDVGNPLKHITEEEKKLLEKKLDMIYNIFIEEVAKNRNISINKTKRLATGEFFLSQEAIKNGLIDKIGDLGDVKKDLEKQLNKTVEFIEIKKQKSFAEQLRRVFGFGFYAIGFGFADALRQSHWEIELR